MTILSETNFESFEPWSGACDTWDRIEREGKLDRLEQALSEIYGDSMADTTLNDMLWFESDEVYKLIGMKTDEEIAEEARERNRVKEDIQSLRDITNPEDICGLVESIGEGLGELSYCDLCPLDQYGCECPYENITALRESLNKLADHFLEIWEDQEE